MDIESNAHYVVLVDVIDSRDIDDRAAFGDALSSVLESVNEDHANALAAPFESIKGIDEFGAVLRRLAPLPTMLDALLEALHPTRLRIAVAAGHIDIGDPAAGITAMDGPAFHRADDLFAEIAAEDLYVGIDTGNPADALLATSLNLLIIAREDRTARQIEVIRAYERHETQTAAAEALDLTPQAVSNTLQRIDYHRTMTLRNLIERSCAHFYD